VQLETCSLISLPPIILPQCSFIPDCTNSARMRRMVNVVVFISYGPYLLIHLKWSRMSSRTPLCWLLMSQNTDVNVISYWQDAFVLHKILFYGSDLTSHRNLLEIWWLLASVLCVIVLHTINIFWWIISRSQVSQHFGSFCAVQLLLVFVLPVHLILD
jgi:hypothetical protein